LELLKNRGCASVQGFHFAGPLAAADRTELLRNGGIIGIS
jgi:EAL domain-containing protein (putative c-di-GMP-specific phosphodiesterase class I)